MHRNLRFVAFLAATAAFTTGLSSSLPESVAHAQPASSDERARLHFEAGRSYFDEGNYERALAEFEQAFALSQRPQLHYNLFITNERLGRLDLAVSHLEAFLATDPAEAETLRARLANLRERQEQRAEAARQELAAREEAERRASEAEARARAAEAQRGQEAAPAATDDRSGLHPAAIVGYGVGGAGLVTFAIAGSLVLVHDADFSRGCLGIGDCSEGALDRQDRRALIADIGLGVGVAGAVAGVLVHVLTHESDDASPTALLVPTLARDGAGVRVLGRF